GRESDAGSGKREAGNGPDSHGPRALQGRQAGREHCGQRRVSHGRAGAEGRLHGARVETTAGRTLLGEYAVGRPVNLERALRAADRLGGHFVQGHVDGVALVERVTQVEDAWIYDLRVPRPVREISIPHGAITVDGVSLTINDLPGPDSVQISLIPFTRAHTTLGTLRVGDRVHVEGDVLGKYVRQLCRTAT